MWLNDGDVVDYTVLVGNEWSWRMMTMDAMEHVLDTKGHLGVYLGLAEKCGCSTGISEASCSHL